MLKQVEEQKMKAERTLEAKKFKEQQTL